ncbi:hypothetical protein N5C55_22375 [Pseudomonas otitidis]|uniref:hypothetical protein n=1 Tax=Metapseudomonas otitidis TaxID=319939 RepID=UPI002449BF1B|nr:hypothetical protein [Pseudomonas otitidis]MDH1108441.1 hypothetical protein [Pseudomonas otitidis]MDH1160928.1 hypothetical protein [Pseudomonas otitidis]MDH1167198.1 hypothetical protein [Pseudomonas otitidis]
MSVDTGLTVDVVRYAMGLEHLRARVAAQNIAMANVPGGKVMRLDIAGALQSLRAVRNDPALLAQGLEQASLGEASIHVQERPVEGTPALDAEVAELSAASGRYQALADGISRQYALMQLAIRGGR